jgi:hypothetical protein
MEQMDIEDPMKVDVDYVKDVYKAGNTEVW